MSFPGDSLRPLAATEAASRVASVANPKQETIDRFSAFATGKVFKAEVLSSLTDGSFNVKVADTTVQLNLPAGTQVGDELDLTLIANHPRPAFSLSAPNTGTQEAKLSQAGKLIDTLLRTAQADGASTALIGKAAVVDTPATPPAQVANALKETLTYSGLFYESHVGQWASGERSLTELMREPQARYSSPQQAPSEASLATAADAPALLPKGSPNLAAELAGELYSPRSMAPSASPSIIEGRNENAHAHNTSTSPPATALPDASTDVPNTIAAGTASEASETTPDTASDTNTSSQPADTAESAQSSTPTTTTTTPHSRIEARQGDIAQMVSLQLDTLEHQRVMWRGEVWPGQPMEWEVTEDAPGQHGASGGSETSWQSVLRVELPVLGAVSATVRLNGQHVQVQVRAADENTAALLRSHGDQLTSALDAAGSPLDLLTVRQDASV